jgi:carbamoyl-phosphate synthase large subunit
VITPSDPSPKTPVPSSVETVNRHMGAEADKTDHSKTTWRVLIVPGGTEIALELRQALAWCKEVELYSASASVSNHAPFVFAKHLYLPMVMETGWLETLQQIIERESITHIFPAHDDALLALAENADNVNAKVVTSPFETCQITRSKQSTIQRLETVVPTPRIFSSPAVVDSFPVFLKPDRGQGAQRTDCARDAEELKALLRSDSDRIIMEFLPGQEFTVDCFSDRERGLLYARGRERRRIRHGIAMDSAFVPDERFYDYAVRISAELKFHGAWFFQVKEDSQKQLRLLEVAPRIGGTSCLSRVCGVNLPLLSLYESERITVSIEAAGYMACVDRALISRFQTDIVYRTIYLDFDDTLLVRGLVNTDLLKLLYQALNKGIRLVLLTRHSGDIQNTLKHYRLNSLFDEIIHLRPGEQKAAAIREKEAVFIDDSFSECMAVRKSLGIPALTPSMIEVLFDERV